MVEVKRQPKYEARCEKCGSVLSYTYNDVLYDSCKAHEHYIMCPVCGDEVPARNPDYPDPYE